ncbi:MAG: cation:proton antiporter [Desulfobulbus sp.]
MSQESIFFIIAGLLAASTLCQWGAWRVKLPAIIFLLLTGILVGPVLGLLHPEQLLGNFFFPFISISVAVILFEGSLTLRFKDIMGFETVIRNMVSFGMVITWLITAVTAHYVIGMCWQISFLFGAITVVTGPTVISPILRTVRPTANIANILRWESIVIDPIGAALSVLVYEYIITASAGSPWGHTLLFFLRLLIVGTSIGIGCGYFLGAALRSNRIPDFLRNVGTLSVVLVSFIAANGLQSESGLVTVTVMGIWLANMKDVDVQGIIDFKESISLLLISLLFITLAARIDLQSLIGLGWRALVLFLAIQFLARPLNIVISATGSKLSWPERHFLAWIAPRGIVAAAISALFAVQLEKAGFADANLLSPLTFFVIIATVLLQSTTARFLAKWLKVTEPEPKGFLIIGANIVARALAQALTHNGVQIILADTVRGNVTKAKIDGLACYFGNPFSEHADQFLPLTGIGRILALSSHETINVAAAMHYRNELGTDKVFVIQSKLRERVSERIRLPIQRLSRTLFGSSITHSYISWVLSHGGSIHTTKLTNHFGFTEFIKRHGYRAVPLFAIDPKHAVHVFCEELQIDPKSDWLIIYLRQPDRRKMPRKQTPPTTTPQPACDPSNRVLPCPPNELF